MEYIDFDEKWLYLAHDDNRTVYVRRSNDIKKAIPWGQRKLLLIEIRFLSMFVKEVEKPKIVYAGAAPGKHIEKLAELFPQCEFFLWDPMVFHIKESDKIHIKQDYFTDEIARQWANRNDVFFISDIRTADYEKINDLDENETQIMSDMNLQQGWYEIIKPIKALLKFRLPYSGGNRPKTLKYLSGQVLKQIWAPQTSTETRLIPDGSYMEWDCIKYEEQLFYFNTTVREQFKFKQPFGEFISEELVNDFDSIAEIYVLGLYLKTMQLDPSITNIIKLSEEITDSLNKGKKFRDTLSILRANTRLIKDRNKKKTASKITVIRKNKLIINHMH